jgi:predicted O-methyltransferase YrrM
MNEAASRDEPGIRTLFRGILRAVAALGSARRGAVELLALRQPARTGGFPTVNEWPERLAAFEDLSFLLSSNVLNHGIAALRLDEAAFLYRLARSLDKGATVAEIGRFIGGSTLLLAAATTNAEIHSYDLPVRYGFSGEEFDRELRHALSRYGLEARVRLVVADSKSADPPARPCDLVFLDGDHSYSGVRVDYEHWRSSVRTGGGHLVFHDAVSAADLVPPYETGVAAVVREIEHEDAAYFERRSGAGSLAHFVRTRTPAPWNRG